MKSPSPFSPLPLSSRRSESINQVSAVTVKQSILDESSAAIQRQVDVIIGTTAQSIADTIQAKNVRDLGQKLALPSVED